MDDATDGREAGFDLANHALNIVGIGDVASVQNNVRSERLGVLNNLSDLRGDSIRTGYDHYVLGSLSNHPLDHAATDTARPTDNNIGSVAAEKVIESLLGIRDLCNYYHQQLVRKSRVNRDQISP